MLFSVGQTASLAVTSLYNFSFFCFGRSSESEVHSTIRYPDHPFVLGVFQPPISRYVGRAGRSRKESNECVPACNPAYQARGNHSLPFAPSLCKWKHALHKMCRAMKNTTFCSSCSLDGALYRLGLRACTRNSPRNLHREPSVSLPTSIR